MKPQENSNRRRAERVPLAMEWGRAQAIVGAEADWPNHERTPVYDLSHFGLAVARPTLFEFKANDLVALDLHLGAVNTVAVKGRIAWSNNRTVGVEITELSSLARLQFERFLSDHFIGRNLRRVDKRFYGQDADFSIWFHGPGDTNVYLWQAPEGVIERAEIEVDGEILQFDGREIYPQGRTSLVFRAMTVLSQMDESKSILKPLLEALAEAER